MEPTRPEQIEVTEKKKCAKRKKYFLVISIAVCVFMTVGACYYVWTPYRKRNDTGQNRGDFPPEINSEYITATGVTVVGVETEEFEVDFLEDTELYVEKVYFQSGDEVATGEQYIRFSDDSIADARKELEDAALNASITYRSSAIETQENRIKAEYTYKQALLAGKQAQAVYDDKIAELSQALEQALQIYEDAQEELEELQNNLSGGYEEEFDVAAKKRAYEDNQQLYHDILEKYDMTEDDLTEKEATNADAGNRKMQQQDSDIKWQKAAINLVKEEYEESEEEYEQAQSDLEDALANYELKLKKAQNKLDEARASYDEAQLTYDKESFLAKKTLETALVTAQTAKADYETQITSFNEALEKLADEQETAASNLAIFEECVGDGYLHTSGAGSILRVMAQEGSTLEGGNPVLVYEDASQMTVSVSVAQEYISQLTVGEDAYVSIDDCGEFDGKIASINPVSTSGSKTSVSYTVEIAFEGDISRITANLTANVAFGATKEDMQNAKEAMKKEFDEAEKMESGKLSEMPEDEMKAGMTGGKEHE